MSKFATVVGYLFILAFVLGMLNFIDFHICLKAAGACQ